MIPPFGVAPQVAELMMVQVNWATASLMAQGSWWSNNPDVVLSEEAAVLDHWVDGGAARSTAWHGMNVVQVRRTMGRDQEADHILPFSPRELARLVLVVPFALSIEQTHFAQDHQNPAKENTYVNV